MIYIAYVFATIMVYTMWIVLWVSIYLAVAHLFLKRRSWYKHFIDLFFVIDRDYETIDLGWLWHVHVWPYYMWRFRKEAIAKAVAEKLKS